MNDTEKKHLNILAMLLIVFAVPCISAHAERWDIASVSAETEQRPSDDELPKARHLIFRGEPQQLLREKEAGENTLEYALGKDAVSAPQTGWTEEIPSGTDPKTYYVWVRIKDNTGFLSVCIPAVIEDLHFETEWQSETVYQRYSNSPVSFCFHTDAYPDPAKKENFAGVLCNDVELDDTCYEIDWPLQKIEMTHSYLDRLEEGEYVIAVLFDIGERNCYADGRFAVREENSTDNQMEEAADESLKLLALLAVLIPILVLAVLLKMTV